MLTTAQTSSSKTSVQGPDGSPASQTVQSATMVLTTLKNLQQVLGQVDEAYMQHLDIVAMLTLVCEYFFSTMRSRYEMPLTLQFAQFFSPVVRESIKQRTTCSFQYFLSNRSYQGTYSLCVGSLVRLSSTPITSKKMAIGPMGCPVKSMVGGTNCLEWNFLRGTCGCQRPTMGVKPGFRDRLGFLEARG